jgi:hypothetical protein
MNEAMKQAWMEITPMLGEPTNEELTVFLHTWQRAMQAEREACAKFFEDHWRETWTDEQVAEAIRARGQA